MNLIDDKRTLRSAMLAWRSGLEEAERRTAADGLLATLRRERPIETPTVVSGFWPIKEEIDIRPLLIELSNQGCQLALPVVQGKGLPLIFRAWRPGDPLEAGVFGTLQPSAKREVDGARCLDRAAACLRRGGMAVGLWRRLLRPHARPACAPRRRVTAVGVGFNDQLVPEVPHGPSDQRLDWLLTDKRACAFV